MRPEWSWLLWKCKLKKEIRSKVVFCLFLNCHRKSVLPDETSEYYRYISGSSQSCSRILYVSTLCYIFSKWEHIWAEVNFIKKCKFKPKVVFLYFSKAAIKFRNKMLFNFTWLRHVATQYTSLYLDKTIINLKLLNTFIAHNICLLAIAK